MIYDCFLTDDCYSYYTVTKDDNSCFTEDELCKFHHVVIVSRTKKTVIIEVKLI